MSPLRRCSRAGCAQAAVATLTYVYADSTAVVGPLATYAEPHTYDLCTNHAGRLTAPRGWDVVRHEGEFAEPEPTVDDLTALAEAVREAGLAGLSARAESIAKQELPEIDGSSTEADILRRQRVQFAMAQLVEEARARRVKAQRRARRSSSAPTTARTTPSAS
jgi:hypothetical protein